MIFMYARFALSAHLHGPPLLISAPNRIIAAATIFMTAAVLREITPPTKTKPPQFIPEMPENAYAPFSIHISLKAAAII